MKAISFKLLLSVLLLLATNSYAREYTLGGNYSFSGINAFSDERTLNFEASGIFSVLRNEADEFCLAVDYRINWEENAYNRVISETSQLVPSFFYRRHFFFMGKDGGLPVFLYFGPNVGIAKIRPSSMSSGFQMVAGLAWGIHIFLLKDTSLDILLFNTSKEFITERILFNQAIGIRFYF